MECNLLLYSLLLSFFCSSVYGQSQYFVRFKDKKNVDVESVLSSYSLNKRIESGKSIDEYDYPVCEEYICHLMKIPELKLGYTSRWLNGVWVTANVPPEVIKSTCTCILSVEEVKRNRTRQSGEKNNEYGSSFKQVNMLGLDDLHRMGYLGAGVRIGILDAGYLNADSLNAFNEVRNRNGIIICHDFIDNEYDVYRDNNHGMEVLSTIAGYIPDTFMGAAIESDFILVRTESVGYEKKSEEENWVRAAEWLDSIGVDVIQTSLNYNYFDDDIGNYSYQDLDGSTPLITKAAELAASRGILVVNSAGNDGAKKWRHIIPPCDGPNVLCVGAVNRDKKIAPFSSRGPTADGRIKPDVVALGDAATIISPQGYVSYSRGTSFAAPQIAGMAACLKQAHPTASSEDLREAIIYSGDRYENPDNDYGYGLPDARKADFRLYNKCGNVQYTVIPSIRNQEWRINIEADIDFDFAATLENECGEQVFILNNLKTNAQHILKAPELEPGQYEWRFSWRLSHVAFSTTLF